MGKTRQAQGQETQTISPLVDLTLKTTAGNSNLYFQGGERLRGNHAYQQSKLKGLDKESFFQDKKSEQQRPDKLTVKAIL